MTLPSGTLLLTPRPSGCAFVQDHHLDPRCPEPPAYALTCSFTGLTAKACVDHTAWMRSAHPDWISRVTTA